MCFDMRMERTALHAKENGFNVIATTNATSRWKDARQVDDSGVRAAAKYVPGSAAPPPSAPPPSAPPPSAPPPSAPPPSPVPPSPPRPARVSAPA
jgi:hypothetical protein